ncbi:MAG: hypothetical protein WD827_05355 [Solirubrobacterales bacterium]
MRFSRHAKTRITLHSLSEHNVAEIVATGDDSAVDPRGRQIFTGRAGDGRVAHVTTALDDPEFVIAVACEVER